MNFQIFKLDLEQKEEPEIKLPTPLDHQKSKRVPEKHLLLLIDYAKAFDCTIALISHASKVMLKILQVRLQQYMNQELPDVQAGFRKGRVCVCVCCVFSHFSHVQPFAILWTIARQVPLSMGFSR